MFYQKLSLAELVESSFELMQPIVEDANLIVIAFASNEQWAKAIKSREKREQASFATDVNIYGPKSRAAEVGNQLSSGYLQRPLAGCDSCEYFNPHYLEIYNSSQEDAQAPTQSQLVQSDDSQNGEELSAQQQITSILDNNLAHNHILTARHINKGIITRQLLEYVPIGDELETISLQS